MADKRTARAVIDTDTGVFIDAIGGHHACRHPQQLLSKRMLTWSKHYGWVYDVWVEDASAFALKGANGRFSLPGVCARVGDVAQGAALMLFQSK